MPFSVEFPLYLTVKVCMVPLELIQGVSHGTTSHFQLCAVIHDCNTNMARNCSRSMLDVPSVGSVGNHFLWHHHFLSNKKPCQPLKEMPIHTQQSCDRCLRFIKWGPRCYHECVSHYCYQCKKCPSLSCIGTLLASDCLSHEHQATNQTQQSNCHTRWHCGIACVWCTSQTFPWVGLSENLVVAHSLVCT